MAGNLIRGLSKVPWDDVIRNAPVVAAVAREMWDNMRQPAAPPRDVPPGQTPHSPEAPDVARLQVQLDAVQAAASDLRRQMLESSELIAALAEQNTQLIRRIEANRVRTLWLTRATIVIGIVAVLNLVLLLTS
jgi:cytochrome c-type biogenesis protein CcmH/NrfG